MRSKASSARQKAYEFIQQQIVSGAWSAGSIVSEIAVARELGSSRTPVREAARQLAGEGFLEQTAQGTLAVTQLHRLDIVEIFELREAIEVYAVGKAARFALGAGVVQRLQGLLNECEALRRDLSKRRQARLNQAQMAKFIQADLGFHTLLMHAAANRRMLKLVAETRLLIRVFAIPRDGHNASQLLAIQQQHQAILSAVQAGNSDEAKALLTAHIQASCRERMVAYDHWERERALDHFSA